MDNKVYICNNCAITNAVEDENFLHIEGYAAHFNRANLNSERVTKESFDEFFELYNNKKLVPGLNWNHDPNMYIGGITGLTTDKNGLYMKARLNKNVKIVAEMLLPNILSEDIRGLSTEGFVDYTDIEYLKDGTYMCKKFLLTNIAVVKTPADWEAGFSISNLFKNNKPQEPAKPRKSIVYMW